jgi:hypothetical protein
MNDGAGRYRPLTADERKAPALGEAADKVEPPTIPPADAGSAEDAARKVFRRKPDAIWTYRNAKGDPLFHVARFDDDGGKKILPLCWTGKGWKSKAWPAPRPLYALDKIAARPDATIIICEGEKAADAAALIFPDFVVTTSSGGAQSAGKTDWSPLAGRRVLIWPDADKSGADYASEVVAILVELGCEVSILDAVALAKVDPNGGEREPTKKGWDAADALAEWPDLDALREAALNLAAPVEAPGGGEGQEQEALDALAGGDLTSFVELAKADPGFPFEPNAVAALNKLAKSRPADFERLRAGLKAEKVRVAALEATMRVGAGAEVADGDDGIIGRPISYDEIEPWGEPVNGAELLTELAGAVGAYVIMDKHQRDAMALWAVFVHAHDLRDYAPLLIITSPLKRCGKTRLQETLARLVPRPQPMSGVTAALFPRLIEKHRPTLLIDEFDAMARGDKDMAEMLRGLLNSSFSKRSAVVLKLVPLPGGGHEPRQFSTWAPTCIAGIGTMSDTVEDRSVIIRLMRKLPDEFVRLLRGKDGGELDALKRKIDRWVGDNELRLRHAEPKAPDALNDRQADAWEPLLAIADVAGGEWPQRAREAALALGGADNVNAAERDVKVMLLADVREIFERLCPEEHLAHTAERAGRPDDGPRLLTKRLLDELHRLEERPWSAFGKAKKPLTDIGLAGLLHDYQIRSTTVRSEDAMGNPDRGRGYYLRSFDDAFARYLPSSGVPTCDNVTNLENAEENAVFADVTNSICHGLENSGYANKTGVCHGVTAQKEGTRGPAGNQGPNDHDDAPREGLI